MKKILFFIRSLNAGGAERQLVVTAKGLAERGHKITVLTFYSGGFYADELTNTKVQLLSLNKKGRWDLLAFFYRLFKALRQQSPDVIYSYMNTANILAVILRPFISPARIVWGVRASNMDLDNYDWLSRWCYWLECRLSRFADVIIANSNAGLEYAVEHGFPRQKITVIPNGIDCERFYPDKSAGDQLRQLWGVAENERLIGVVGRIDPMKGIPIFLEAATIIKQRHARVRFVWVGVGEASYEKAIRELATQLGLDDVLIWAGCNSDMTAVYNAFDITSSSSYGEGFPNVLGEAMACGVPCVATDVGDSALIIGQTGQVTHPNDARSLADAILIQLELKTKGQIQRDRIVSRYSLSKLCAKTEDILCL